MRICAPYAYRFPSAFHIRMVIIVGCGSCPCRITCISSIQFHSIPRINFTECNTETCAEAHQQQDFHFFPFSTFISGLKIFLLLLLGKGIRGKVAMNRFAYDKLWIWEKKNNKHQTTHTVDWLWAGRLKEREDLLLVAHIQCILFTKYVEIRPCKDKMRSSDVLEKTRSSSAQNTYAQTCP